MFHRLHFTFSTHTVYSQSPSSSTTSISILSFSLSWLLLPFPHQRSPSRRRSFPFRSPHNGRPCSSRSHRNPSIAASPLPPPTTAVPAPNAAARTPCCTSSPRSPTESIPTGSPSGTPPLTIASASAVATRIGIRIAGADISRKSTSKSASFRFSNYTDFNLRLLACFYRSFCLEYFKTLACYTYVGEGKLPNDPKDLPSAEEALSDPYFTGLANMTVNHPLNPFQNLSLNLREGN
ncbi:uncharacterized protein LOC114396242 [Glycine soja]|uniref:Uncharacterized protein n=1 Tax=Glycine soja TaxID=3848 RepID=A0A445FR42_GLYSO|nr:uncharacterized protein LOC114396242 [Glycine soja]RZB51346.1 hypothetical protein D0Y65_047965 [Glycine soja]